MPGYSPLLNPPAFPPDRYAVLADRLRALLGTQNDLVFVQAEAILALEAVTTSLAQPGLVALNIVTSPYGAMSGQWLRRGGVEVHEVSAETGRPIGIAAVKAALDALPRVDIVVIVHAETSTGILNPLEQVVALGRTRQALVVVDAVASFGGHALDIDALGIDICVAGPQKSVGGPAGLSVVTVSPAAWAAIEKAAASSPSNLSLGDLKRNWLDQGRGALPGMPSALEFWALEAALDMLEAETLPVRIARHALAGHASRGGIRGLGLVPWIEALDEVSALATAAPVPEGIDADQLIGLAAEFGAVLTPAFGALRGRLVRLDHTGARAAFAPVLANVMGYGLAMRQLGHPVELGRAAEAVADRYANG